MTSEKLLATLESLDLFDGLGAERLRVFAATASELNTEAGEFVLREGDLFDAFYVLIEGRIEWSKVIDATDVPLGSIEGPTYMGVVSSLTDQLWQASARALTDLTAFSIPGDALRELLRDEPATHQHVLRLVGQVSQFQEAAVQQREKLAALGRLSAGLAHELNNPAAAARRSASELGEALGGLEQTVSRFLDSGISREQRQSLVELHKEAMTASQEPPTLDVLELSERADEFAAMLVNADVDAYLVAPVLADAGLDRAWLERLVTAAGAGLGAAADWISSSLSARTLVADLHESVGRISELVGAVKEYSYVDRGVEQEVDIHRGLESTLTVLNHKIRAANISIARDYDKELPHVSARGSELNQVWTNLIDNAIDAIAGEGTITLRTLQLNGQLAVQVIDDGPGIPDDVRDHLFEPFYTTKGVGEGTGLGLDVARRIVATHGGEIVVSSKPGETCFDVRLPLDTASRRRSSAISTER
jgi:signal transduction histidine kinase